MKRSSYDLCMFEDDDVTHLAPQHQSTNPSTATFNCHLQEIAVSSKNLSHSLSPLAHSVLYTHIIRQSPPASFSYTHFLPSRFFSRSRCSCCAWRSLYQRTSDRAARYRGERARVPLDKAPYRCLDKAKSLLSASHFIGPPARSTLHRLFSLSAATAYRSSLSLYIYSPLVYAVDIVSGCTYV